MIVGVAFFNSKTKRLVTMEKPNRHVDIIHVLYEETGKQVSGADGWVQGFIDENHKFYDRHDGAKHVLKVGQNLTDYAKEEYKDRKIEILFSEDVW